MSSRSSRDEIQNLLARYCHHLDAGDAKALAELFTEDADLDVMGRQIHGRAAILDWFGQMGDAPALSIHLTSNFTVDVDGDVGSARSNWSTLRLGRSSRTWSVFAVGTYTDEFFRTESGWRFRSRVDAALGGFTFEEMIAAYLAAD